MYFVCLISVIEKVELTYSDFQTLRRYSKTSVDFKLTATSCLTYYYTSSEK